jgi:peptidoglycan/LPS O-acetylase OafA/YrhL
VTEQTLATTRILHEQHGVVVWFATSVLSTYALAFLSWHLVESPALRLKDWTPVIRLPRRSGDTAFRIGTPKQTRAEDVPTELNRVPCRGAERR